MPNNVSREEALALVGDEQTAPGEAVELRDFRQPRRLSQARQHSIRQSIVRRLPKIEAELSSWLRAETAVSLSGIGESSAFGLFDDQEDPLTILTVEVGGVQGWLVWDNLAAQHAVQATLGSAAPEELVTRELAPLEAGLIIDIVGVLIGHLEDVLGLTIRTCALSQSLRAFVAQHDSDPGADPQRLFLHFDIEGIGEPSTLRLYLPGVLPEHGERPRERRTQLPKHLDDVPLTLSAVLGSTEVLLSDLMKIEVGDVIPLNTPVGSSVEVLVEGGSTGSARWGSHKGCLALSIEHLDGTKKETASHE